MPIPNITAMGGILMTAGIAGEIVESWGPGGIVSGINENATPLDFGQVCVRGVAVALPPFNVKPQTADGDLIFGITVRDPSQVASTDGNNTVNYKQFQAVRVMKKGRLYVIAAENVVAGTQALIITAGSGSKIASTTGGAVGAGRIAFQTGAAYWDTTTTSGNVGILSVNLA